ncbi:hypothetical protein B0H13DRAFT_1850257 [Mycena leptocephala]|nr:hypothetical protein B0H13DRAFT_1850257 [Mycena leptocephala]
MAPPSSSATADNIRTLQHSVIPVLARARVSNISVPGLERAVNGVSELANIVSTMKDNKKGLVALKRSVDALADLKVQVATGGLERRVTELSSVSRKMTVSSMTWHRKVLEFTVLNNGAVIHIYNQLGVLMETLAKCSTTSMLPVKLTLGMI